MILGTRTVQPSSIGVPHRFVQYSKDQFHKSPWVHTSHTPAFHSIRLSRGLLQVREFKSENFATCRRQNMQVRHRCISAGRSPHSPNVTRMTEKMCRRQISNSNLSYLAIKNMAEKVPDLTCSSSPISVVPHLHTSCVVCVKP